MSAQNKLWAGMAKETAHQIGTPLSSLLGWIEIMKADDIDEMIVSEIEIDINRLQTIADRFSKIGSAPVLERIDVAEETQKSFEYLTSRFSKQVVFTFKSLPTPVLIDLNAALHSWTIENLVKNAIDAMKGRGSISVLMTTNTFKFGFLIREREFQKKTLIKFLNLVLPLKKEVGDWVFHSQNVLWKNTIVEK